MGAAGIQRGGLQETALRLARPERMHLRQALVEELLRLGIGGRDRQMHRSHTGQDLAGSVGASELGGGVQLSALFGGLGGGGKRESKYERRTSWLVLQLSCDWFASICRVIRCTS